MPLIARGRGCIYLSAWLCPVAIDFEISMWGAAHSERSSEKKNKAKKKWLFQTDKPVKKKGRLYLFSGISLQFNVLEILSGRNNVIPVTVLNLPSNNFPDSSTTTDWVTSSLPAAWLSEQDLVVEKSFPVQQVLSLKQSWPMRKWPPAAGHLC